MVQTVDQDTFMNHLHRVPSRKFSTFLRCNSREILHDKHVHEYCYAYEVEEGWIFTEQWKTFASKSTQRCNVRKNQAQVLITLAARKKKTDEEVRIVVKAD